MRSFHFALRIIVAGLLLATSLGGPGAAVESRDEPPLVPWSVARSLAEEISGGAARRTVQELTLHHRMRGSRGFAAAAGLIRAALEEAGLEGVEILSLPADGTIMYGTQRSRPAWDAEFGELWELIQSQGPDVESWAPSRRVASWASSPIGLAQDSASGLAEADLVDVGAGSAEKDYEGKEVKGMLVLTSEQPGSVARLAVEARGAAGVVSYAQNQKTAWWKEDGSLVRWGHMESFPAPAGFGFMISLDQARAWKERMARGERVRLRAVVEAGAHPGAYLIPTAVIPGNDPALREREIVFSCHLDHPSPGANDNASGCATILEVARSLARLSGAGVLPPPRRTIRFVWPAEIEGTIALLNARPGQAARTDAVIHMDMVGGNPSITKAVFHVTRSPASMPSFTDDVAEAIGRFVNRETSKFAGGKETDFPLVDPEGGREALLAEMAPFSMGSDHQVWTEGSFRVPAIYLNDWPDRYIHTNKDVVDNIDATKLKRAAFIGAACGWYLSRLTSDEVPALWEVMRRHVLERRAAAHERAERAESAAGSSGGEGGNLLRFHSVRERQAFESISRFAPIPDDLKRDADRLFGMLASLLPATYSMALPLAIDDQARVIYVRRPEPKGPMHGFGYSYIDARVKELGLETPKLGDHRGVWGGGGEYAYLALNLVDGRRSVQAIRNDLSAIYGPVPLDLVQEYLETLAKIGVLELR